MEGRSRDRAMGVPEKSYLQEIRVLSPSDSISFSYSRSLKPKMLSSSEIGHSISLCSFSFINSLFQYEMRIMERR
ncbi:hypothetical protein L2E82_41729 [Cichorium intybus]|uniref:Uncharacterized protein n=1 Tax=Cichorium intybus TaxID=13427 RepID=A0ACB8ZL72_CICIN|nr:hypothetical protein L2E82_41729 [Cichorium intybus]